MTTQTSASTTIRHLAGKLVLSEPFRNWLAGHHGLHHDFHTKILPPDEVVSTYLNENLSIRVTRDGALQPRQINSFVRKFIGGLDIIVFHHTSSALIDSIRERGLVADIHKVGRQAPTARGVFVTTEATGERPSLFARRAVEKFGGEG